METAAAQNDVELEMVLEAIYARYQHDFRHYARPMLRRRLAHALRATGCDSYPLLRHRLLHDPGVCAQVLAELTISVTDLFRDPAFFLALKERVLPRLRGAPSIKVWVAGCSTGEELYSLAILLEEEGLLDRAVLYATDINAQALETAARGIYPLEEAPRYSTAYLQAGGRRSLSDYGHAAYGGFAFDKRLKRNVVFADHSLATDSVFAEVQLVSCRNVLIYFEPALKDRALALFRDSLAEGGCLALGARESLRGTAWSSTFTEVDGTHRIYERT